MTPTLRDQRLPQLPSTLDPCFMTKMFRKLHAESGEGAWIVERTELGWTKYRPGESCRYAYRLGLVNRQTSDTAELLVFARAYPPGSGSARDRYERAAGRPLVKPFVGPAAFHIPELEMVGWSFPNDRKLPCLGRFVSLSSLGEDVLPHLPAGSAPAARGTDARAPCLSIVHYVPERSCSVRLTFPGEGAAGEGSRDLPPTYFGKAYADGAACRRALAIQEALWASDSCQRGEVRLARPVLLQEPTNAVWQEGLPGETLFDLGARGGVRPDHLHLAGRAVAALHAIPPGIDAPGDDAHATGKEVESAAALVAAVRPDLAARLQVLARSISSRRDRIDREPAVTLHGDLHSKNLLVDARGNDSSRRKVSLIDLDSAHLGPASKDLGSFLASLHSQAAVSGCSAHAVRRQVSAFLSGYESRSSFRIDPTAVRWQTARCLLVERAVRCVTRLKEGRLLLLDKILARAEELGGAA